MGNKTGRSISVTLPIPLVDDLQKGADKVGISRSRFISNILLKWQEGTTLEQNLDHAGQESPPNDCGNREDDGFCRNFEQICNAEQKGADTCAGYGGKK